MFRFWAHKLEQGSEIELAPAEPEAREPVSDGLSEAVTEAPPVRWSPPADVVQGLAQPADVDAELVEMGVPGDHSPVYQGRLRERLPPDDDVERFLRWAQLVGAHGRYNEKTIDALYEEHCHVDHRKRMPSNTLLGLLKQMRRLVRHRRLSAKENPKRPRVYDILPGKRRPRPVADVPVRDPVNEKPPAATAKAPARDHLSLPVDLTAVRQARAHEMRRASRHKKQRGSRMHRRAA